MSEIFTQIINKYENLSEQDKSIKINELRAELSTPDIVRDIDIISDAPLRFLLVAKEIEALGKNNTTRQRLALDFLNLANKQFLASLGIEYCTVKNGKKSFAIPYLLLGERLTQRESCAKSFWRGVYLIVNAIYASEKRSVGNWFDTAQYMYGNFLAESYLVATIPGLTFNSAGVRHDMLCATNGTHDPDFIYTEPLDIKYTAEFKKPTKSVAALARYAFNNPDYIYNADILFTYDSQTLEFVKIDYTMPDLRTNSNYTITSLGIKCDSTKA